MANAKALSDAEFEKLDGEARDDLSNAETTNEAVGALWRGLWLKIKKSRPPVTKRSLEDVLALLDDPDAREMHQDGQGLTVWGDYAKSLVAFLGEKEDDNDQSEDDLPNVSLAQMGDVNVSLKVRSRNAVVLTEWLLSGAIKAGSLQWADAVLFQAHKAFLSAKKMGYEGKHPLTPVIIKLQDRMPKAKVESTSIYDARRPAAFLGFPRGNFTVEMFSDSSPGGSLKRFADDSLLPQSIQTVLPGIDRDRRKSVIRDPSKMLLAHVAGVPTTTRKGAVSPEVRVCVEAITQVPPKERLIQVHVILGDLIDRLYPNGFNWTNQAPTLIAAIMNIDNLRVPFRNSSGRIQTGWAPVTLNTKELSRRDDDVIFTVSLPEDATVGPMVEKKYVRLLGLISAPKWQAYFALCDLFHRHGLQKCKGGFYLADPTKPVERRNADGYLLNTQGEVIYGTDGAPLTDPYHTDAVDQLDREPNPEGIDKYPIVPLGDFPKATFPGRVYKSTTEKTEYFNRAKNHFRELADLPSKAFGEKKGKKTEPKAPHIIKIIEDPDSYTDGWRFLPGESHIKVYRGVSAGGE